MRILHVLPCLVLLGCDSATDVIAKQRPAVEKTFASVKALDEKVRAAPPVTEAMVRSAPIVLEGGASASNAMFVYADDLAAPGEAKAVHLRTLDSAPLLQCGALLSRGTYFGDSVTRVAPSVAGQYLAACARLEYALVIRLVEFKPPALDLLSRKFAPGLYRAEVLVFDVRKGELLGGFPVTATNDERVSLLDGDADHVKRLISNLESTTFTALRAATRAAVPGSLPPPVSAP